MPEELVIEAAIEADFEGNFCQYNEYGNAEGWEEPDCFFELKTVSLS